MQPTVHIIGFGSIGRGMIRMLEEMLKITRDQIRVYDKSVDAVAAARDMGINAICYEVKKTNYSGFLANIANVFMGDVVLNLAVDVGSREVMRWCQRRGAFYLDTCVEPWAGGYKTYRKVPMTNGELRENLLAQPYAPDYEYLCNTQTTALIAHGANPGLITYFIRAALDELAHNFWVHEEQTHCGANLAQKLGVKVIQIAENDTQTSRGERVAGEFHNTWSVPGFIAELRQPIEAGVGSHEDKKVLRKFGRVKVRNQAWQFVGTQNHLGTPGYMKKVKSWTPDKGPGEAYMVTHHEALSVNAHMQITHEGQLIYAPTVFYAYQPCPAAVESIQELTMNNEMREHLMCPDDGYDQLGALLIYEGAYGHGAYWYGSTLDQKSARFYGQGPTTLQVTATICAGIRFMLENPKLGVLEAEQLPWREMLDMVRPYLGKVSGHHTSWCPPSLQLQDFFIN